MWVIPGIFYHSTFYHDVGSEFQLFLLLLWPLFVQEHAFESSQKYKEGKYIIELAHMVKENQWDWDRAARVNQIFGLTTQLYNTTPPTTSPLQDCDPLLYDPWVIPDEPVVMINIVQVPNQQDVIEARCPSLLSCLTLFHRLVSFIWQSVWRWPWRPRFTESRRPFSSSCSPLYVMLPLIYYYSISVHYYYYYYYSWYVLLYASNQSNRKDVSLDLFNSNNYTPIQIGSSSYNKTTKKWNQNLSVTLRSIKTSKLQTRKKTVKPYARCYIIYKT